MSFAQYPGYNPHAAAVAVDQVSLSAAMQLAVKAGAMSLRVAMPARIYKVEGNQLVQAQPLYNAVPFSTGKPHPLPVIPHVPVLAPAGQDYSLKLPLQVGDTGLLIFSDRSLDEWMQSGDIVTPDNVSFHNINDAIFVPGLLPTAKQTDDQTSDLVLSNGSAQVRLEKSGKFRVVNTATGGQELVDLVGQLNMALQSLVKSLQQANTITLAGPMPLWGATQLELAQAATTLSKLASDISSIQGD